MRLMGKAPHGRLRKKPLARSNAWKNLKTDTGWDELAL
jgi:hypothetical protein